MVSNLSIRKTEQRKRRWRQLEEATGESTTSKAIDVAVKHYLADLERKRAAIEDMDPELAAALSTPFLPLDVDVERTVGRQLE